MFFTLLAFAFAIGLLVVIHELGHYAVARYYGVHIERFSFGFGKVLLRYTDKRGCQWAFSAIPLGGYVMMRNEAPDTASTAYRDSTLQSKTVWQRIAITAAGPVANLLLAVLLYAVWLGWVQSSLPPCWPSPLQAVPLPRRVLWPKTVSLRWAMMPSKLGRNFVGPCLIGCTVIRLLIFRHRAQTVGSKHGFWLTPRWCSLVTTRPTPWLS